MMKDFKAFLLRGNVADLAVAVVIGAAFTNIVTALVKDLITPFLAAVGGQPDFSRLYFTIHGSRFMYGDFLNQVISFVIIAAVLFFGVVQPLNFLMRHRPRQDKAAKDPQLVVLEEIRDALKK
jgi:large conductance mechanosensitive channel